MKSEIKILNISERITKEGKPYKLVHVLIMIDGKDFVRKFYVF